MKRRLRLLDLFCGAGGAAVGYHRAGFEILGVDHRPQRRYPFPFVESDALAFLKGVELGEYDLIHASPPCQAYTAMLRPSMRQRHPDLIEQTRQRLQESGCHWVIENVPGAPLLNPFVLCGSMFDLRQSGVCLVRHRLFETSWSRFDLIPPCDHRGIALSVCGGGTSSWAGHNLKRISSKAERAALMGIDWMSWDELSQALPPAYTEFSGRQFLALLESAADSRREETVR